MKKNRPHRPRSGVWALSFLLALALPVGADVAETLDRIYAEQDVQTALPEKALESHGDWSLPPGRPLVGIAIVVVCVAVLLIAKGSSADWERLRERLPRLRKRHGKAKGAGAERLPDWFLQADDLAAEGCYAEAVHALLLAVLAVPRLGDRGLPAAATAREIARRLGSDDLRQLVAAAELAHFRGQPATADDFRRCRTRAVRICDGASPVGQTQ